MSNSKRSHAPSLWRTVKKTLINECQIEPNSHLLLGVSGGSDSMALLNVLARLRKESDLNFKLSVVGVNHNLRKEAADEMLLVERVCEKLKVDCYIENVYIEGESNLQCKARDARYAAFEKVKNKCKADYVVTAHHNLDRAETVLMRIIKKTTADKLAVLKPKTGNILRPMILATKNDVMLYIKRKNIEYCEDPSNKKVEKYLRSKIRYEIMPILEEVNPNIVAALCGLSDSSYDMIEQMSH